MHPKDDEMKWNHKKRTKDRFLLFCETVLNHERELLSEVKFLFVCQRFFELRTMKKNFIQFLYLDSHFSAINRHSIHHKNQLVRILLQKVDKITANKIRRLIPIRMVVQIIQMVSFQSNAKRTKRHTKKYSFRKRKIIFSTSLYLSVRFRSFIKKIKFLFYFVL